MHNLREMLPSNDGEWHRGILQLMSEIGVSQAVFVAEDSQELLGAINLPSDPDALSFAHLMLTRRVSLQSGGHVYSPGSLRVFSERCPGIYFQVLFG